MLKLLTTKIFIMKTSFFASHSIIKEIYGHRLSEYLLAVQPTTEVYEKILNERRLFYDEYKVKEIIKKNPQLIVAGFLVKEAMEETLGRWIQRICSQQQRFTLTLNNYSGFPQNSIFLRVQNEQPFQKLSAALKELNPYITSCACPPMQFTSRLHIRLADYLPENIYANALKKYAHKTFHESFTVTELQLLKRRNEYDTYKPISVFSLQPAEDTCSVLS
jgi:2'-5' RNA ligase superfamily